METANMQTAERRFDFDAYTRDDELAEKRLNNLLSLNAETNRRREMFGSDREEFEAALMSNPLSIEKTFSYFGLLLGTFAPAAIFTRVFIDTKTFESNEFWILGVAVFVNLISATAGFFSGKFIAKLVADLERVSWTQMILTLPFIGIFWGILAGGAGGLIVFIFGAFLGAALGAAVGSVGLPLFVIFHRLLKRGDKIEGKHFLPLAFGIALVISAFILGL
ncbi:MAG TPA: hypothetical protein VNI84_05610 [Pyrinomonadaceae bacterium]|nr:hypothetical protein [Pyrinomonadaceae bacterium]